MKKSPSVYLRLIFLLGDLFIINLVILLSSYTFADADTNFRNNFTFTASASTLLWLLLSFVLNPYKFSRVSRFAKVLRIHFAFILMHFLVLISVIFLAGKTPANILSLPFIFL